VNPVSFIAHVIDPFGIEEPALVWTHQDGSSETIALDQLSAVKELVVTYEVPTLINALRAEGYALPAQLIEVKDALKLLLGIAKDQGGERKWNTFRQLAALEPGSYAKELAGMMRGQRLQPSRSSLYEMLAKAANALVALWGRPPSFPRHGG
jgi:hypothetical protein